MRRSPRFQKGSPSRLSETVSVPARTPLEETHRPPVPVPVAAPQVDPPPWVASIEKVGASLKGLFSKFASFGAAMQQQQSVAPVAPSTKTVSPPDDRTSIPEPPEYSSSRDIDSDAASRRQNIRLTHEADMPAEDEPEDSGPSPLHRGSSADDPNRDESSSSPKARKKRKVDDEDDSEDIVRSVRPSTGCIQSLANSLAPCRLSGGSLC